MSVSSNEALQLLQEGNKRFSAGEFATKDLGQTRRDELIIKGQNPFAIIITCSDSRVPPELIFDSGLGDLFVIRTAGNVLDPVGMGSAEYAVEHLGTPLLVVLGHDKCGAVQATMDGGEAPGSVAAIVAKIAPSAEKARAAGITGDNLYEECCLENIKATVAEVMGSEIIQHFVEDGKLAVIGAKYYMSSGEVEFF
ncbi:MAG: carbonic anhydrase [Peptococcaceae bacterium]|nr:carbonic anhydrase [Peptococcaceae bacterium]